MLSLADAREAYEATRRTAEDALDRALGPAQERLRKATAEAASIGERIPREVLDAWLAACRRGQEIYQSIITGAREDVDDALRAAGILTDERD